MIDESVLSVNLLTFRKKSFGFLRLLARGAHGYAVFHRTETETESKLRPKLLGLWVLCPTEWLLYDEPTDGLLIGADGVVPGPELPGTALETASEAERFLEQGLRWIRRPWGADRFVYIPEAREAEFGGAAGWDEGELLP
ncbi:MAG: hypothetical protein ACYDFT_02670 [Thermoplasmata archaeon]